jgi:hypothetical protein
MRMSDPEERKGKINRPQLRYSSGELDSVTSMWNCAFALFLAFSILLALSRSRSPMRQLAGLWIFSARPRAERDNRTHAAFRSVE